MKVIIAISVFLATIPSLAMTAYDSGAIVFTKDEVQVLTTRIKDQDEAVEFLMKEVRRLKEQVESVKDKSCT